MGKKKETWLSEFLRRSLTAGSPENGGPPGSLTEMNRTLDAASR